MSKKGQSQSSMDIVGQKFNQLQVQKLVSVVKYSNGNYNCEYECLCDCGKICIKRGMSIVSGRSVCCRSCSGLKRSKARKTKLPSRFLGGIRRRSIEKGFICNVTDEYLWDLFESQSKKCALTGIDITIGQMAFDYAGTTASLDRIDSSIGYVIGNVQWVHKQINFMKLDMSQAKFIEWCKLVAKRN